MSERPRLLAAAILAWTVIAWGGRVGLLTSGDDWADITRIAGSIVVGVAAAVALYAGRPGRWMRATLYGFVIWTVAIWGRSLVVNWTGPGSLPFKLVHTVLALGFLSLSVWVWATARAIRRAHE